MTAHARLAPSQIARWMACAGSVQAESQVIHPTSRYAAEGTWAHQIFAACLLTGITAVELMDGADVEQIAALETALHETRQVIRGRQFAVEQRLPALPGEPDIWGTTDTVVFNDDGRVADVVDLKFGAGVVVEANTPQLAAYACLAAARYRPSPDGIAVHIAQPRAWHTAGTLRSHHYSLAALGEFATRMRAAAVATRAPNAPRHAGAHCLFCAVKATCGEYQRYALADLTRNVVLEKVESR